MILAIDVHYTDTTAVTAGVLYESCGSPAPTQEYISKIANVEPYESGSFYKRELPCILTLLNEHSLAPDSIVIDGYVFLDGDRKPGLGKYLHDTLGGQVVVVGVAKTPYPDISDDHKIYRGKSKTPLYVTTTSDLAVAKKDIVCMHGEFRIPTLLKLADQLCRARQTNKM